MTVRQNVVGQPALPASEDAICRPAVKGAVDFDGAELLDIVGEADAQGDPKWIEDVLPVVMVPAGSADV